MNMEVTDLDMILNYLETTNLESHDDYTSEFTYKDQKILYKYIKELQQKNQQLNSKLELYENGVYYSSEIDEKDKEIDKLKEENAELNKQLKIKEDGFKAVNEELCEYAEENESLKKQHDYLRSGEYYNQLRFENEMLQQVVDTNGVPSEVYDYIDCTHRNTELLEQQQEFIKYLNDKIKVVHKTSIWEVTNIDLVEEGYEEILSKYKEIIGGVEDEK